MSYTEICNLPWMYIFVACVLAFILLQNFVMMRKAWKHAREDLHYTNAQIRKGLTNGILVSIVPTIPVVIVLLTLIPLLGGGEAVVVLEKPPVLTVVSDSTTAAAMQGGYQWEKTLADGTVEHALADSAHPLDCRELLTLLDTREGVAELEFSQMPDEIFSARCWSDVYWGEPETAGEPVTVEDGKLTLKPGRYVYEVGARWDTASGYGGTAYYAFYIDYME